MSRINLFTLAFALLITSAQAQLSRVHVKAPVGSTWGISSEAPANRKLIGFTHDGTTGLISTGTADGTTQYSPIKFATGGQPRMTILENGYVGIGTTSPNVELTVAGKIYAREVKVNISTGTAPDYVFQDTYELPSLSYVAGYINQHRHLPSVPSAAEMEKDGVSVGEMNMILLRKVEELTLYILDQDKKLNAVTEKLNLLQQQVNTK